MSGRGEAGMKKPRRRRTIIAFQVAEVFPPGERLAMNLLRLMAFHQDLSFLGDLMRANMVMPRKRAAQYVAASRWFLLQRIFGALVAEFVIVLDELQNDATFHTLVAAMDRGGQRALARLRELPKDQKNPTFRVLHRTRNQATFHFDRKQFAAALRRFIDRYGPDAESTFLFEPEPGRRRGRMYYSLADHVTTEIAFGLPSIEGPPAPHDAFLAAIEVHTALSDFLERAMVAYCRLRGIQPDAFRKQEQ